MRRMLYEEDIENETVKLYEPLTNGLDHKWGTFSGPIGTFGVL